jgi:hypothetical protein
VNGCELYDIAADPGQQHNVAAEHPELVKRMQAHYGAWWDELGGNLESYQPILIGSDEENPMRMCSPDWAWAYADNQQNIRGCTMDSGVWHVEVAKSGTYTLTLRRWPEESGLGISAPAPMMQGVDGTWPEGKALPVASAWLRAGQREQTRRVPGEATEIAFEMELERGPAQIQSWWIDADGNQLAGAYYMTVERRDS